MVLNKIKNSSYLDPSDYVHIGDFELSYIIRSHMNILFITGLSGSGKTTLALDLERRLNISGGIIELDNFEHGITSKCPFVWKYIENNPKLRHRFENHWRCVDTKEFMNEFIKFMDWLLPELRAMDDKTFIVEGMQLFMYDPRRLMVGDVVIVKMTNARESYHRASVRDAGKESEFPRINMDRMRKLERTRDNWLKAHKKIVAAYENSRPNKGVNRAPSIVTRANSINESTSSSGSDWDESFYPCYTPAEMLKLGVFEGKYLNDDKSEYPSSWFSGAKVTGAGNPPDVSLNKYGIKSRLSLKEWKAKGWIDINDPKGWFQWYCRYFQGRRIPDVDKKQIGRWRSFVARHMGGLKSGASLKDESKQPKRRQGLLQWAWDSTKPFDDERVKRDNLRKMEKDRGR